MPERAGKTRTLRTIIYIQERPVKRFKLLAIYLDELPIQVELFDQHIAPKEVSDYDTFREVVWDNLRIALPLYFGERYGWEPSSAKAPHGKKTFEYVQVWPGCGRKIITDSLYIVWNGGENRSFAWEAGESTESMLKRFKDGVSATAFSFTVIFVRNGINNSYAVRASSLERLVGTLLSFIDMGILPEWVKNIEKDAYIFVPNEGGGDDYIALIEHIVTI